MATGVCFVLYLRLFLAAGLIPVGSTSLLASVVGRCLFPSARLPRRFRCLVHWSCYGCVGVALSAASLRADAFDLVALVCSFASGAEDGYIRLHHFDKAYHSNKCVQFCVLFPSPSLVALAQPRVFALSLLLPVLSGGSPWPRLPL